MLKFLIISWLHSGYMHAIKYVDATFYWCCAPVFPCLAFGFALHRVISPWFVNIAQCMYFLLFVDGGRQWFSKGRNSFPHDCMPSPPFFISLFKSFNEMALLLSCYHVCRNVSYLYINLIVYRIRTLTNILKYLVPNRLLSNSIYMLFYDSKQFLSIIYVPVLLIVVGSPQKVVDSRVGSFFLIF